MFSLFDWFIHSGLFEDVQSCQKTFVALFLSLPSFSGERNTGESREKLLVKGREPTTNSTHI